MCFFVLQESVHDAQCIVTTSGTSNLGKRGLSGRAASDITFQHKTTFSLKHWKSTDEICDVAKESYWQNYAYYAVYQQYFLIKAATLVFCTECSETQVAALSL